MSLCDIMTSSETEQDRQERIKPSGDTIPYLWHLSIGFLRILLRIFHILAKVPINTLYPYPSRIHRFEKLIMFCLSTAGPGFEYCMNSL